MNKPLLLFFILIVTFGKAQSVLPKDSARVNMLFRNAMKCDLYGQARQSYLDTILTIDHRYAWAWQQKAMPMFKQRKYSVGLTWLDSAVAYQKNVEWLEYRAFIKCIFLKDYVGAILDFEKSAQKNPIGFVMDHSYDFYIGISYLMLNNFKEAEKYIDRSLREGEQRTGEGHFLEYFYQGIVRMEENRLDAAITSFQIAIKYYPCFSDAQFYLAKCLYQQHHTEDANELFKKGYACKKQGFTINEDNVIYELYPYQVREEEYRAKLKLTH